MKKKQTALKGGTNDGAADLPSEPNKKDEAARTTSPKSKNPTLEGEESAHVEVTTSTDSVTTKKDIDTAARDKTSTQTPAPDEDPNSDRETAAAEISGSQNKTKLDVEREAARISLAGQVTALRASGCKILEARLSSAGEPILIVEEDGDTIGFNEHVRDRGSLPRALADGLFECHIADARSALISQVRTIFAGNAALDHADITGCLGLTSSDTWALNESWAEEVLRSFAECLGIDEAPLEPLEVTIWEDANTLVGQTWNHVVWCYMNLRDQHDRAPSVWVDHPVDLRVSQERVRAIFDYCEGSAMATRCEEL